MNKGLYLGTAAAAAMSSLHDFNRGKNSGATANQNTTEFITKRAKKKKKSRKQANSSKRRNRK